jgi:feruloyl esterase
MCAMLLAATPAAAQRAPALAQLASVPPVTSCASLASLDLAPVTGASTTLAAREVAGNHPHCAVTGTIAPAIRFEVRLPLAGWTQRYLQTGCGGLCGNLRINPVKAAGCTPVTDGSIVLASTDMGHQGMDPSWGANPQQREDFAHRGVHLTALAAKALIKAFYGRPQRYAYFSGCSDGGREALIEAQRYPDDFDGIAAGAPALNFAAQNSFHHGWLAHSNMGADDMPLLTAVDMPLLHQAVLAACDALDGLTDGQITDPRLCRYDPAPLLCKGEAQPGKCLTNDQITAVRRIYTGASTAEGQKLEVGAILPGSEMEWIGVFVPTGKSAPIMSARFADDTINHLLFTPNPAPPFTIASFPFDAAMHAREAQARRLYNADNPDLAPFAAHGGKLILWHGWADPHISPINTIDYYARIGRKMGETARRQTVRMFLFPGMGHCSGGSGPDEFGMLAALMAWTETATAPDVLIAHRATPAANGPPPGAPPPAAAMLGPPPSRNQADLPPRSRPVFPYPAVARYAGKGSIDESGNFIPTMPPPADDITDWIGKGR